MRRAGTYLCLAAAMIACGMSFACGSDEAEDPEPYYRQAEGLRAQEKPEEAIELYQRAVAADPEYGPAYLGMAQSYSALGDQAQGEKNYLLAVAMSPEDLSAHLNFAGFYYRFRNYERALQVLQQAMDIASEGEETALVSSLWTRVEAANVRATVRRQLIAALAEDPGDEAAVARLAESYAAEATDLMQGGNEGEALAVVSEGMGAVPEEAQAEIYYVGAQAQAALGDGARGFEWLEKAVELDPTVPVYHLSHAGFLIDRGELDAALAELDRVSEMAPGSEEAEFARIRRTDVERMQQMTDDELQEYLDQRRAQRFKKSSPGGSPSD